jgi:hypothetical protein
MRMKRVLVIFLLVLAAIYAGDLLSARFGFPGNRATFDSVMVTRTLEVATKDPKKDEYFFPTPEAETCVNALFPHFGAPPCWYLKRHTKQHVQM